MKCCTKLELNIPGLKKILGLIGGLQPEHVLLFRIVLGLSGQRVVYPDGVVQIVAAHLVLPEPVLVLVQVQHQVPERAVEHLPAALVKRR